MKLNEVISNHSATEDILMDAIGWRKARVCGWGKNSFRMLMENAGSELEFNVSFKMMKKNTKVRAWFSFPVNGLPLEDVQVPLKGKDLEVMRVPSDSDFGAIARMVWDMKEKHAKKICGPFEKEARESKEAKALWHMTI